MLVEHWNGSEWSVVETPLPPHGGSIFEQVSGDNIRDIAVLAADDIWFVGDWIEILPSGLSQQRGLALHWDGSDLTVTDTPYIAGTHGSGLETVSALAADDIWAVGGGGDGDDTGVSTIIHWDGTSWKHVPGPAPGFFHRLYDVVALAPNDVWAVGDYFDGAYKPLFLHWNGSSWQQYASPAGGRVLAPLAAERILSLAGGSVALWEGASWQLTGAIPNPNISLADADVTGPCALWAVGRQFSGSVQSTFTVRLVANTAGTPGDLNCDGTIDAFDIDPFVLALTDPAGYAAQWPDCDATLADITGDGKVDAFDIDPFVALLTEK
jgi:hypothetical protein